jgi:hypothetical protein
MRATRTRRIIPAALAVFTMMLLGSPAAHALPLYARQTGQECAACHNGFPELTPYGRLFKLNGYTFGGGQSDLPPVSVMAVSSYTHTQAPQAAAPAPHYGTNNNFAFDFVSLFTGGAITPNIGAFIQGTYNNDTATGGVFHWDNTDIRYAGTTRFLDSETILGVSLNNNPTVTDVWNSTPAWGFPFVTSALAPAPGTKTAIEGTFSQEVVGATAYTFWNRLIYAEAGPYSTLTKGMDSALGVSQTVSSIKGVAPYWRLAVEPKWGANSLELGTFGFAAALNPARVTGFGTDHVVDIGFDTQYQFLGERDSISLQASYITENQSLSASQAIGNATNGRNHLRSLRLKTSYYYDQTYGITAGYFQVRGDADAGLFATTSANNSPNSAGWIGELDYIPFNHGGPSFWPWLNLKLGLQYIYYDKFNGNQTNFDGTGRNAHDNNTLFAFVWLAF